jgi:hypothetical protein
MKSIIPLIDTQTDEKENCLSAPAKKLYYAQNQGMLFGCGVNCETIALMREPGSRNQASTVPHSETSQSSYRRSLSDRLAKSLLSADLIAGITPTLTRVRFGADCRDGVLLRLDGDMSESEAGEQEPKAENSF